MSKNETSHRFDFMARVDIAGAAILSPNTAGSDFLPAPRLCWMRASAAPAKKEVAYSRQGLEFGRALRRESRASKPDHPPLWGLIPSIRSGSKYTNLSSALR